MSRPATAPPPAPPTPHRAPTPGPVVRDPGVADLVTPMGPEGRSSMAVALFAAIAIAVAAAVWATGRATATATAAAEDVAVGAATDAASPPPGDPAVDGRAVARVVAVGPGRSGVAVTVPPASLPATTVAPPVPLAPPVRLSMPSLGIDAAPVIEVGLLDDGGMEVPDVSLVGWYRYGPSPGETGTAVLAAHVAYGGRNGVFAHLEDLQAGDPLVVRHADGVERRWVVAAVEQHDKEALPVERLFTRAGPPTLALITCGGEFLWSTGHYRDNVVVFARPAA